MKVYRIAKQKFLSDLSGEGARLYGGRWNNAGYNMVYFSENLSLCVLEMLVHLEYKYINNDFGFIEVDIPDEFIKPTLKIKSLDENWRNNPPIGFTQDKGTAWLQSQKSLAMRVPSAVLPKEYNILMNPKHMSSSEIKIIKKGKLDIDSRIF
ncbi:MAG: RES family NAD+ phosphorylase [Flavobacteriaceae bacterium]|nr:RES family NAD+ phosphorylase [Flavobacteriaceae bacterium]